MLRRVIFILNNFNCRSITLTDEISRICRGDMRTSLVKILCLVLVAGVCSCGQWKVSTLKGKKVLTIGAGTAPGNVMIDYGDGATLNLSFMVRVFGGKVYTIDNILKRLQVMERDGKPLVVIGQKGTPETGKKDIRFTSFNFSIIGLLTVDSNGSIFVQNRLQPSAGVPRTGQGDELDFSPSYILVFDSKGNLQHTIGQKGTPDLPFYYIESLETDKKDRLFVISRSYDTWSVYRFSGKRRDFYQSFGNNDFKETEKQDTFTGRIENIKVFRSGEAFLVSVAYYHGSRFKYRKIFEYEMSGGKPGRTLVTIPDPRNELFALVDDKLLYMWNMEGRNAKFVILNFDGNVMNNILITLQDNKYFEDIFTDETGQLYSMHVGRKEIEVMEWK